VKIQIQMNILNGGECLCQGQVVMAHVRLLQLAKY